MGDKCYYWSALYLSLWPITYWQCVSVFFVCVSFSCLCFLSIMIACMVKQGSDSKKCMCCKSRGLCILVFCGFFLFKLMLLSLIWRSFMSKKDLDLFLASWVNFMLPVFRWSLSSCGCLAFIYSNMSSTFFFPEGECPLCKCCYYCFFFPLFN